MNILVAAAIAIITALVSASVAYRGFKRSEFSLRDLGAWSAVTVPIGIASLLIAGFWSSGAGVAPSEWLFPTFPATGGKRLVHLAYLLLSSGIAVACINAYIRIRGPRAQV